MKKLFLLFFVLTTQLSARDLVWHEGSVVLASREVTLKKADQIEVLSKAAAAGFHIVDVELESAEAIKKSELRKLRDTGVAVIISHHDFNATKDLDGIYKRIVPFEPDFIKIVPTAKSLVDNVTLMRFIERMEDHSNIIGICMGDAGIISRVLGLRAGSAFTLSESWVLVGSREGG